MPQLSDAFVLEIFKATGEIAAIQKLILEMIAASPGHNPEQIQLIETAKTLIGTMQTSLERAMEAEAKRIGNQ